MLLAGLLPIASLSALAIVALVIFILICCSQLPVLELLRGLMRLRWLFISIAILYLWYTPGPALAAPEWLTIPVNLPSYLGIELALERALVLAVLYAAVMICLHSMTPNEIVAGLAWVLRPLALCKIPVDLFSQRLAETLVSVRKIQTTLSAARESSEVTTASAWLNGIAERGTGAITLIESESLAVSESASSETIGDDATMALTLQDGCVAVAAALGMVGVISCV